MKKTIHKLLFVLLVSIVPLASAAGNPADQFSQFNSAIMVLGGTIVGIIIFVLLIMLWVHFRNKGKEKETGESIKEYQMPIQQGS